MDIFLLKAVTDGFWYLAVFGPILLQGSKAFRAVFALIPAAWMVWLALNWKRRRIAANVLDVFMLEVRLLTVAGFFELIFMGPGSWGRQCAPFAALFLISGILLLRAARLMESGQVRGGFWKENGVQFAVILAATAVIASKMMRHMLGLALIHGYQKLILPVLIGILELAGGFLMWLWPYLAALFPELSVRNQDREMAEITAGPPIDLGEPGSGNAPFYLRAIGIGLIVLAGTACFIYLYRRFSEAGGGLKRKAAGEINRSILAPEGKGKRKRRWPGGEKDVRYYYRKFLELCMKKGLEPEPQNTTEDIHRAALQWWKEETLLELRALYLEARYGREEQGKKRAKKPRDQGREKGPQGKKRAEELYRIIRAEEKERQKTQNKGEK